MPSTTSPIAASASSPSPAAASASSSPPPSRSRTRTASPVAARSASPKRQRTASPSQAEEEGSSSSPSPRRTDPVAALLSASASSLAAQDAAASRLQRAFRETFRRPMARRLARLFLAPGAGVTAEGVRAMSFEQLTVHLRSPAVIGLTLRVLRLIHRRASERHPHAPLAADAPATVNVRVFLAAYMIAFRPTHIFEDGFGMLEGALFRATVPLVEAFERIVVSLAERPGDAAPDNRVDAAWAGFQAMLFDYLARFRAWKGPDEQRLSTRIRHALIALYEGQAQLPADDPADSPIRVEFRTQIERLRTKLVQISGQAVLDAFDASRAAQPPLAPVQGGGALVAGRAAATGRVTNEQLAHELLLDPAFQLTETGETTLAANPIYSRIRESFHRAFWDSLADDLRLSPQPCFVRVARVLSEVRDGIAELSAQREADAIREVIDVDFIRGQAALGIYAWNSCRGLIAGVVEIIRRVQAPARDAETRARWADVDAGMRAADADAGARPASLCRALEFLLGRVNVMRIDAANARLRLIAPVIRDYGIDYERGKFEARLQSGELTVARTEAWLERTVRAGVPPSVARLEDLVAGAPQAFVAVHAAAMLSLVADPLQAPVSADTVPETLLMDLHRIADLRCEFDRIARGVTLLVAANHALGAAPLGAGAVMAELTAEVVRAAAPEDLAAIVSDRLPAMLDAARVLVGDQERARVLDALARCLARPDDPVHRLMVARVRSAWLDHMLTLAPVDRSRFAAVARPLAPLVETAAARLARLAGVNRAVHTPTYNRLIAEVAARAVLVAAPAV